MPGGVKMSVSGFDDSRTAPLNAAGHGFRSSTCRLAGWPSFGTTPQRAFGAVFAIRDLVFPAGQGLSVAGSKQLTVSPSECLGIELVSRRYEHKSTVITTNRAFKEGGEKFPSAACTVSLIDRLVHRCEVVAIEGESYRLKEAKGRATACRSSRCCVTSSAPLRTTPQTTSTKPTCRSDRGPHQQCWRSPQKRRPTQPRLVDPSKKRGLTAKFTREVTTANTRRLPSSCWPGSGAPAWFATAGAGCRGRRPASPCAHRDASPGVGCGCAARPPRRVWRPASGQCG